MKAVRSDGPDFWAEKRPKKAKSQRPDGWHVDAFEGSDSDTQHK